MAHKRKKSKKAASFNRKHPRKADGTFRKKPKSKRKK